MKMIANIPVVSPNWEDMPWVLTFTTAVNDGDPVFDFRNFSQNENCKILQNALPVKELAWLNIQHSAVVSRKPKYEESPADAAIISEKQTAVAITTADCLPIVLADVHSHTIALIHAGWRGIANGIIENCINMLDQKTLNDLRVWIGPSVRDDYIIGLDVKEQLLGSENVTEQSFVQIDENKCFADLCSIAKCKMMFFGIDKNNIETFPESTIQCERFFSVRRDGADTGRMATVAALL